MTEIFTYCDYCGGTGHVGRQREHCHICGGSGYTRITGQVAVDRSWFLDLDRVLNGETDDTGTAVRGYLADVIAEPA